jgi:hypothetical protein
MSYMTRIPGYPDRDDIRAGMASFQGSGPAGSTCETCAHRGYHRNTGKPAKGCWMFLKLTHRHGPAIDRHWRACRYYAPRTTESTNRTRR